MTPEQDGRPRSSRQIRNPKRPRQGRDGGRLQGVRPAHRARRRAQDHPEGRSRSRTRAGVHGAVQERSESRRPPASPEYRRRLRVRRGRQGRLHRDGVRRRHGPARVPQSPGELRLRPARRAHDADAERARVRARAGRGPSRHQAVEPDRYQPGPGQGRGLRRRARRRVGPDERRDGDRHAVVYVPRAVQRAADRWRAPICSARGSFSTSS